MRQIREATMVDPSSVTLAGDLTRPATVLIEKISDAIGVIYEPTRIRRRAEGEAKAELISAQAEIEKGELLDRSLKRLAIQEVRKQQNIENITDQAIRELPSDANSEQLDEDWVAHFFKKCDGVSDEEMQSLWGRLLAGEATKPGSYSKRTINLVESLDKKDAELFTVFCQFLWFVSEPAACVFDHNHSVFKDAGIQFPELKRLEEAGLISFDLLSGFGRGPFGKYALVTYFGHPTVLEFPNESDNTLKLGCVVLTDAGQQLASVSGAKPSEAYHEYVIEKWSAENLHPQSPLNSPARGSAA